MLEKLTGTPWPGGLERIREDASPSLRGYDGWFDSGDNEIVIGEKLDADLIFHELSHAWLSGDRFDRRWIFEGLAQVLAERTVEATAAMPAEPSKASRTDEDAVPLNLWNGSSSTPSDDVDAYAYPASHVVTRALLADLDDSELAAVVGAGIRGERAYDPEGTRDPYGRRTSWSRWLDILETRGGVTDAAAVFQTWVLNADQRAQLAPRAQARDAYAAVDEGDGDWLPPEGLREAMTAWDFERASSVHEQVAGLGVAVLEVQDAAAQAEVPVPESVRESYENAEQGEQYAALATSLPRAAGAITAVGEALGDASQDRDPVSDLGATVLGVQDHADEAAALLDAGDLGAAVAAAGTASSRADQSLLVGLALPLLILLGLVGALFVTRQVVRTRAARRAAAEAERHLTPAGSSAGNPVARDPGGVTLDP